MQDSTQSDIQQAEEGAITRFMGANRFLSNFFAVVVEFEGERYPTVEHAFQAAKSRDPKIRERIAKAPTPGKAKGMGRLIPRGAFRNDWDKVRVEVMEELLVGKFLHHGLRAKLVDTYPKQLIEGNDWGDRFWGAEWRPMFVGMGDLSNPDSPAGWRGENRLGELLMKIRGELV